MKRKGCGKLAAVALLIICLAGCQSLGTALARIKKQFCALDLYRVETTLSAEAAFADGIYWHFYNLFYQDGNVKAGPVLLALDDFLLLAKPILAGLQKGICYDENLIQETNAKSDSLRTQVAVFEGETALAAPRVAVR